jgi:hypothetical protein
MPSRSFENGAYFLFKRVGFFMPSYALVCRFVKHLFYSPAVVALADVAFPGVRCPVFIQEWHITPQCITFTSTRTCLRCAPASRLRQR